MQLPSYPTSVPSGSTLSGNDHRSSTPGSHLLHRAVENNSINNSLSSNNGNHLLNPSSNSNNKAPLMTINENWAALDASTMMSQPPMTLSNESKRRADNANFSSLPTSTFHAIRSNYPVKDRQQSSQRNHSRITQSPSSSSKSHHRRHQAQERRQNRENKSMQQRVEAQKQKLDNDNLSPSHSRKQSRLDDRQISNKEDTENNSDHASEDSDTDSSDSSDCSRSASRSRSDTQSRHDGDASSDDEDSGSNNSRSGSSSSYSSDEEDDDSSSSSCCSSQVNSSFISRVGEVFVYIYIISRFNS